MILRDALAERQADSGTRNVGTVQTLEDSEYAVGVLHGKTNAIVLHRNPDEISLASCPYVDAWRDARRPVFDRVTDQVLKELNTLFTIAG
jgi:hypothetical protein